MIGMRGARSLADRQFWLAEKLRPVSAQPKGYGKLQMIGNGAAVFLAAAPSA